MAGRHLIGLDIGSRFIKAVQLSDAGGRYRISEFGIVEVTPQVSVPDAVMELFARKRFKKPHRVVTSVSGRFVFVRYINMPVMTDEELSNAAKYELGKYIPVEVDEVLHDCQKLEELAPQEGQEAEMRVLLVAAKRTFIDEHVNILEAAGLQPAVIDVDSFALGNAYELSGISQPEAIAQGKLVALVDIGASKTNINIMSDSVSFFTREFYKGGDDLTESISKKLALEMGEAEAMKRNFAQMGGMGGGDEGGPATATAMSMDEPSANLPIVLLEQGDTEKMRRGPAPEVGQNERVHESIAGILDDICHDINISIDYFENQYDRRVEEIYITGGASNTVGLQESLERTVQKPVNRWNPLQYIEADSALPADSAQELQDYASQAAIALGLAARITG